MTTEQSSAGSTEEEWYLQNVIFVEDVRHVPIGEVLKVDGALAMVHFSSKNFERDSKNDSKSMDVDSMLKESVIRRKDELQVGQTKVLFLKKYILHLKVSKSL